jgi:hypothetical protein
VKCCKLLELGSSTAPSGSGESWFEPRRDNSATAPGFGLAPFAISEGMWGRMLGYPLPRTEPAGRALAGDVVLMGYAFALLPMPPKLEARANTFATT